MDMETAVKTALDRANFRAALAFVQSMQETPEEWLLFKKLYRAGYCSNFAAPTIPTSAFAHSHEIVEKRGWAIRTKSGRNLECQEHHVT